MSERKFDSELSLIRQAVARGWCNPKNKHKEMDVDLAEAISYEVLNQLYDLHGEGKETVHDLIPLRGLSIEEIKRNYPEQYAQAITEAEEFTDAQPDPWEEWIGKAPRNEDYEHWRAWSIDLYLWFRKMPRR